MIVLCVWILSMCKLQRITHKLNIKPLYDMGFSVLREDNCDLYFMVE